ncbi:MULTISPECIES: RagB/SusD family nutrient uptake outer membrane protein [Bacteroides]|uniref:RagB/SusD family nutrient uptake outer membrane protein n=1 Tax=Bacteroides TaxID=816 RepID=UPI000E43478A|nr:MULTISPECIES: RagB/SusD family nutrient uptake outer membrane protein [Bacteroides]MBS7574162.1 RagB/SusD family nutrient uptake outer membrane protein [Bacteroides propionicigenes]RGM27072.1 RagB/SusD family nutrient uptake outer membrane protein [Bacteroides sp. OM08-17BH]
MKTNLYKVCLLVVSFCLVSCEGLLDEKIYDFRTESNFYKTEADFFTAITGAYAGLQEHNYFRNVYFSLLEGCTGQTTNNAGSKERYTKTYTSTYGDVQNLWKCVYANINICNDIILGISNNTEVSDDIKNAYIGEAKFLRAMDYFNLVRIYGALPLRQEPSQGFANAFMERTSEEEVYDLIIDDLKFAMSVLPDKSPDAGRATKGAATGLLAKVYLTLASTSKYEENINKRYAFASNSIQKYYTYARDYALTIVESEQYSLLEDYSYLWDLKHENSKESLFEVQFIRQSTGNGMNIPQLIMPSASGRCGLKGNGWSSYRSTKYAYDEFDKGDYRIESTFLGGADGIWEKLTNGIPNGKTGKCYPASKTGTTQWPLLGKYQDPFADTANNHECNFIYLRYADILLILAEAENEINPLSDVAYDAINKVRARARLAGSTVNAIPADYENISSQDEFRQLVWKERRLELNSECHLWYDLIRTGQYKIYLDAYNAHPQNTAKDIEMPFYERNLLFPIPADEISNNESISISDQNPGHV